MTHLLDTDHISILQQPADPLGPVVGGHVGRRPRADVAVSVVSFGEQTGGANAAVNSARTAPQVLLAYSYLDTILTFYHGWTALPFDTAAATIFFQLKAQRIRIGTMDLRIAAIALSRNLVVVTRNTRDFAQVPGLALDDWTK